jgi:hypothetical protein
MYRRSKFALLSLAITLVIASESAVGAPVKNTTSAPVTAVSSSPFKEFSPTFVGPAATGCKSAGCALLTGPFFSPSTASFTEDSVVPMLNNSVSGGRREMPEPKRPRPPVQATPSFVVPPTVSCEPLGAGCDTIDRSASGAVGVKGIDAADNGELSTNVLGLDIEPPDQGMCAGNGYVVETNNQGSILIFNTALERKSAVIPLDTVMGLTDRGWSSGGDPSCVYDYDNGGHWFFTQFVSASTEASEGPFAGCFAGVAYACYEGIAVSQGSSPFGPYSVYFVSADYDPAEPGYPYLLNDFAKIATTRDAFLLFYDEFPLVLPGLGGGGFNGAQQFAFNKRALELGLPVTGRDGLPNPAFTVARQNMGLLPTPNGTCFSDDTYHLPGITCWYAVIPANPPDPSQYDNTHGGSGFMLESLDFYGLGDDRVAVFAWTGLGELNTPNCSGCSGIQFGSQIFNGVLPYYNLGFVSPQASGAIPLGDECGAAGLSSATSCPEGAIATNGDDVTQVSQAQGQIWGSVSTQISQTFSSETTPELHQGALYWVIGTQSFDTSGQFSFSGEGYVSPMHEDLEFPAMAAEGLSYQDGGNGGAIMTFTLSGNGGPTGADGGGFFPSTAYGRLGSSSNGLLESLINIVDMGQSPEDGFTEYEGYPPTASRPRWGDYSHAVFVPETGGRIYFANNYIEYPNCTGSAFTLTVGTCDGTRDGYANWGTSVNYVVP